MYHWNRKCKNCGVDIHHYDRGDKKFCSDKCRKAWSRRKDEVKRLTTDATFRINALARLISEYPDLRELIMQDLLSLQHLIGDHIDVTVTAASVTDKPLVES